MTFLSSSPPTPATQSVSVGAVLACQPFWAALDAEEAEKKLIDVTPAQTEPVEAKQVDDKGPEDGESVND